MVCGGRDGTAQGHTLPPRVVRRPGWGVVMDAPLLSLHPSVTWWPRPLSQWILTESGILSAGCPFASAARSWWDAGPGCSRWGSSEDPELQCKVKGTVVSSQSVSSVAQLCPALCNPMDWSMPGLPVHHQLLESTQTRVHWVGDASSIQPSHPLSSSSPPALNLSQHQGLFQWVSSLHRVAKVLEFQLQHQSFPWTPRTDFL